MDSAYDNIQQEAYPEDTPPPKEGEEPTRPRAGSNDLGTEFKEAYQAISSTPWGARLGGFFGQVKKQSETYYEGARQELAVAGTEAGKGWAGLIAKTQTLTLGQATGSSSTREPGESADAPAKDIVKEAEAILSRFRTDAAARLKQIQKAEDAADEALERFGMNLKNFLRDAVTIAPPSKDAGVKSEVLFESKDAEGKRVVHATRFDAQLHVIHSRLASFSQDPDSSEYASWKTTFDVEKKTEAIARDLEKYDELRRAMDKLVPEQVSYVDFWTRYYFLRHVIETEELKRRELLKGTQTAEEEVAWDDDEEEEDRTQTPNAKEVAPALETEQTEAGAATPTKHDSLPDYSLLKPNESRGSNEHSVADSDASYDIVSGAPSGGPGTPKEKEFGDKKRTSTVGEQSDEEDWE